MYEIRTKFFNQEKAAEPEIRVSFEDLYRYVTFAISRFPTEFRPNLGLGIVIQLDALRYNINKALKINKKETALREADIVLQSLKECIWNCVQLKCIKIGQLDNISRYCQIVGSQINSLRRKYDSEYSNPMGKPLSHREFQENHKRKAID